MTRRHLSTLARAVILVAVAGGLAIGVVSVVTAQTCPAPVRTAQPGDRCTASFVRPNTDKPEPVPVYVVRLKALEASDLASWTVPGAVVVPLDGTQRGQQVAVPLSSLSECRP